MKDRRQMHFPKRLHFSGGEPLLRDDWYQVVYYAKKHSFSISITTNATLITTEVAKMIRDLEVGVVRISFDGSSKKIFELQRTGIENTFEKTIKGISNIVNCGVPVTALSVISRRNIVDLQEIVRKCVDLGIRAINFFPLMPGGRANNINHFVFSPLEFKNFYRKLQYLESKYKDKIQFLHESPLYSVFKAEENNTKEEENGHEDFSRCMAGCTMIFIKENGDVTPCPYFENVVGNLTKESLKEIWMHESLLSDLGKIELLDNECRNCKFVNECFGACRAAAQYAFGTICKKDPFCWRSK